MLVHLASGFHVYGEDDEIDMWIHVDDLSICLGPLASPTILCTWRLGKGYGHVVRW